MKHRQQEGTEPNKGTVRDRNRRVQPTPGERATDRNLGAPYQPQYRLPRIKREKHERGRYRERSAQEKTAEQRSPQRKDYAGPGLAVKLQGTLERWWRKMKHAREVTFEPSTVCKDGTDERSRKWRGGHIPKRGWVAEEKWDPMMKVIRQR